MLNYREEMGQTTTTNDPDWYIEKKNKPSTKTKRVGASGEHFHKLLRNKEYGKFNSPDLVHYFQWVATKAGVRYSISNLPVEARHMKNLLKDYKPDEVCDMVDFVFLSNQSYLDRSRMSPSVLVSSWRNQIFPDSQDWLRGKYVEGSTTTKMRKKKLKAREWGETSKENSAIIGKWDE